MSTTFRILRSENMPESMLLWFADVYGHRGLTLTPTNGDNNHCFNMYDVTFNDDSDAVLFKLKFGGVAFTKDQVILSNAADANPSAEKANLWGEKYVIYQNFENTK